MAPQHYFPPSSRDLRAHAVQRLQAGLFGLSAIVLVVGLANIIKDRARLNEDSVRAAPPVSSSASPSANDPLADIGVVPSSMPNKASPPSASQAAGPAN